MWAENADENMQRKKQFAKFRVLQIEEGKHVCYMNTSEIPSELSGENFISSHVKITCYLHT